MKKKSLKYIILILFFAITSSVTAQEEGSFRDSRDGKTYKTIKIENQTWFAEGLAYKTSSGCWENNKRYSDAGHLYTWETAQNVCPSGWHLPSLAEWNTLIKNLGGEDVAGAKLKRDDYGWDGIWYSSNDAKFNAVGSGVIDPSTDQLNDLEDRAYFWTSTSTDYSNASYIMILAKDKGIRSFSNLKSAGQAVRCVK